MYTLAKSIVLELEGSNSLLVLLITNYMTLNKFSYFPQAQFPVCKTGIKNVYFIELLGLNEIIH